MRFVITLGNRQGYFQEGTAHYDNGREVPLRARRPHGENSVYIDDVEHTKFPVRWRALNGTIGFINQCKSDLEVCLINESGQNIRVDCHGVLRDGESMMVVL